VPAFIVSCIVVLGLDQGFKAIAMHRRPADAGPGFVYRENPSGALGGVSLTVSSIVLLPAVVLFVAVLAMSDWPAVMAVGLGAAVGGAASNFVDQARRGSVIDYLNLPSGPAINLGDIAITVGLAMGVVGLF
jgi:lipoprotein signal peptidase